MRTDWYVVLLSTYIWHKKRKYWHRKNLELRKVRTNSQVVNSTTVTAIQGITVGHIGMGISATPSFLDWFLHCASILNFFRRCALHFFLYFLHRYIWSIFFGSCIGICRDRKYLEDKNIIFFYSSMIFGPHYS